MISRKAIALFAAIATSTIVSFANAADRPDFVATARVKQHMHKTGALVEGEEELLKVILKWKHFPNAEGYELCHNCNHIDDATGKEIGSIDDAADGGNVIPVEVGGRNLCGGEPCNVMPATPRGKNKFYLRVKTDGEWGVWSNYQMFNVEVREGRKKENS